MKNKWVCLSALWSALLLVACNMSDFEWNRLAQPSGLNPVIYRPFAEGTYAVKDYAAVPGFGTTPVTLDSLNFNQIAYPVVGISFNTAGTDSMVVIIKTVNETPMKYRYRLSFSGVTLDSGSKLLNAAAINPQGDVIEFSRDSLEFKLDPAAVAKLGQVQQFDLSVTLYKPGQGTVLANILKSSQISFKIGFRAPINLFKLKI